MCCKIQTVKRYTVLGIKRAQYMYHHWSAETLIWFRYNCPLFYGRITSLPWGRSFLIRNRLHSSTCIQAGDPVMSMSQGYKLKSRRQLTAEQMSSLMNNQVWSFNLNLSFCPMPYLTWNLTGRVTNWWLLQTKQSWKLGDLDTLPMIILQFLGHVQ